ncbi:MAG: neutral/alkaline non-lysosomal ceramidase N-terminal domain-containing protein [Pirellulales bacterium]
MLAFDSFGRLRRSLSALQPFILLIIIAAMLPIHTAQAQTADQKNSESPASQTQGTVIDVGAARVDVTPDYPVRLSGFAVRKTESDGVSQRIYAKALAFGSDAEQPVVLITLDNLGIRTAMVNEVVSRLEAKAKLSRDRFIVTFSHSHCCPKVSGSADNIFAMPISAADQAHIDQYTRQLTDALESVALAALADRSPCRLSWSVGSVGFAKNRRLKDGPVDHDLPVLVVRRADSSVKAVYTTYACHCVTLSHNLISGDWAGYAQDAIERRFPGAIGLVSIGCGSDSNPSSGVTGDKTDIAAAQGLQIGDEVARLIAAGMQPVVGSPRTTFSSIGLKFASVPTEEELNALVAKGGPAGYNAQTQLDRLRRGKTLPSYLDYPIQTLRFGDSLCMVFLAGEVCVDYSLRLKRELEKSRIWLHGYSNDFGAYIPSERLLGEGGYGAGAEIPYFALPDKLATGLERQIVEEVKRQVPPAFHPAGGAGGSKPLDPEASRLKLQTHPEFEVQLAAAEPLVSDPVAIDFGPDGELWVAMMSDYAHAVDDVFTQTGQVRRLRDSDGDGRFDQADTFLSGLRFPTDVKVWRSGLIVCDAPDVIYAEDTDGDGKADVRRVLLTGFATHNAQARVNSLRWSLDNWMVVSCGLFGGVITTEKGEQIDLSSRDFRFQPDTGKIEPMTGRTQQGRARNDWDDWFGCDNGTLVRHYPWPEQLAARNPFVASPPTGVYVPSGPGAGSLFPAGDLVLFKLSGSGGKATSACGLDLYRDELLGAACNNNAFVCEPVNQLVHREVLSRDKGVVRGTRSTDEANSEFLRSTDSWFRPVQVRTGPDGGLWVVDMYRYVIEHPKFIPDETKAELNVFSGQGLGRIYRVVPKGTQTKPMLSLSKLDNSQLGRAMDTANGTVRDLVQQMLLWRDAKEVAGELENLVTEGSTPAVRVSALCTLAGLQSVKPKVLIAAMRDVHPAVRRHAVRLSEPQVEQSPELLSAVIAAADDAEFEVRFAVAAALVAASDSRVPNALVRLAAESRDAYMTAAVLSSVRTENIAVICDAVFAADGPANRSILRDPLIDTAIGLGDAALIGKLFDRVTVSSGTWEAWQLKSTARLLDGIERRGFGLEPTLSEKCRERLSDMLDRARRILAESEISPALKKNALLLLARPGKAWGGMITAQQSTADGDLLVSLVSLQQANDVQGAAADALVRRADESEIRKLLSRAGTATPTIKRQILEAALSRGAWSAIIVELLETKQLRAADMDAAQRERLLSGPNAELQPRIAKIFSESNPARTAVIEKHQPALQLKSDLQNGKLLYTKRCIACHAVAGEGADVGPNLVALTAKSVPYLYSAILDPNKEVDGRYQSYTALTADGRTITGLLAGESAASVTIREQGGKEHSLLRTELEQLKGTGKSLMPEGLEAELSDQDLADLIGYVLNLK